MFIWQSANYCGHEAYKNPQVVGIVPERRSKCVVIVSGFKEPASMPVNFGFDDAQGGLPFAQAA
jgi:hypothetical protein